MRAAALHCISATVRRAVHAWECMHCVRNAVNSNAVQIAPCVQACRACLHRRRAALCYWCTRTRQTDTAAQHWHAYS